MKIKNLGAIKSPPDKRDINLASVQPPVEVPDAWEVDISGIETYYQNGIGSCFVAGTKVRTADGGFKDIENVKIGDEVIDASGKPQIVTNTFKRFWQGNQYVIDVFGIDEPIVCTPEHPIMTGSGYKYAKDITSKDYLVIPINKTVKDKTDYWYETDPDFLYVLGLYIAEGSIEIDRDSGAYRRTCFTMHRKEEPILRYANSVLNRIFGVSGSISIVDNKSELRISGLGNIFSELGGRYAENKRVHSKLMLIEPYLQRKILDGWLAGDGYAKKRGLIGTTISETLAYQMSEIALRNNLIFATNSRDAFDNHKKSFNVSILTQNFKNKGDGWRGNIVDGCLMRRVRIIDILKPKTEALLSGSSVYNIETTGSHSYTANFVAVHNCTAHAAAHYIGAFEKLEGNYPKLSPRYLYALCKKDDGVPEENQGTYLRQVLKKMSNSGMCEDKFFPNSVSLPYKEYKDYTKITYSAYYDAQPRIIKAYGFVSDLSFEGLKRAIYQNNGLLLLIDVGNEYFSGGKAVVPSKVISGHLVYAYGFTKTKIKYIDSIFKDKSLSFRWIEKDYIPFVREAGTAIDIPNWQVKMLTSKIEILKKLVELYIKLRTLLKK